MQRTKERNNVPIMNISDVVLEVKRALTENDLDTVSRYANDKDGRDAVYLVIHQHFMINKLAEINNDEIREELIRTSKASSHYYEWAKSGSHRVKCKLIEHGHYLDTLINDEDPYMRVKVAQRKPRYIRQLLGKTKMELNFVCECVSTGKQIDAEFLDDLLKELKEDKDPELYQALLLKHEANNHQPTTVEKTMTLEQLRLFGSPLWALNLSPFEIVKALNTQHD